jgi:hypothetical protein
LRRAVFASATAALRGLVTDLDPAELAAGASAGQGRLFERLLGVVERLADTAPLLELATAGQKATLGLSRDSPSG